VIGAVAFVGFDDAGSEAFDQFVCEGDVVTLSRRSDQTHRFPSASPAAWILVLKPQRV
jgi:hypothetical protein